MTEPPPQLRMGFTRFEQLAEPRLEGDYALRNFRPGDEDAWVALLATGDFGRWDRTRLEQMFAGERAFLPPDGIFFATYQDRPVGSACTFLHRQEKKTIAELGWVVVDPMHRGRGLSMQICRAVLRFAHRSGCEYAYLLTEEYRPAAIKTYLRLGFEPEMIHPQNPGQWALLRQRLSAPAPVAAGSLNSVGDSHLGRDG